MPAPTMLYVMPENPTPEHRAQLLRSNKKLQKVLGVTPTVTPIPGPSTPAPPISHRRARSATLGNRRERGKISSVFKVREEESLPPRSSVDSVSTVSTSHDDMRFHSDPALPVHRDLTPRRKRKNTLKRRPSVLNLVDSTHRPLASGNENDHAIIDISPESSATLTDRVDLESPISPKFKVDLPSLSRAPSFNYEGEDDDVLTDIVNSPHRSNQNKKAKISRLARHFGTQPPLELVFPPSPTSQSRRDPKRYTYGLPPPFIRGSIDDDEVRVAVEAEASGNDRIADEKAVMVFWDAVADEKGRTEIMDVLRQLKA